MGGQKDSMNFNEVVDKLEVLLKEIKAKSFKERTEVKKDMSIILINKIERFIFTI